MKIAVSWSGGKDSMMMLHHLLSKHLPVQKLFTTFQQEQKRTISHYIKMELVISQAHSLGLSFDEVILPTHSSNEQYEQIMNQFYSKLEAENYDSIAFGDLFLEDIRKYRENHLAKYHLTPIFPIWGNDSNQLAKRFINLGYKAVIVSINGDILSTELLGGEFDENLIDSLPSNCDVCGENGEFHTFVYDGPLFHKPITFRKGGVYQEGGFYWLDLC